MGGLWWGFALGGPSEVGHSLPPCGGVSRPDGRSFISLACPRETEPKRRAPPSGARRAASVECVPRCGVFLTGHPWPAEKWPTSCRPPFGPCPSRSTASRGDKGGKLGNFKRHVRHVRQH